MTDSLALADALVDGLVHAGVRELVICPGSRSSPLAYAAWAAERAGRLRLHVRVDERSAAFLALGLAKLSRRPAVVVTTSGTAVANLHPAVLEAHHARVPLVVLSADRPAALRGSGANQTTTQPGIFGGVGTGILRDEADLGPQTTVMDVVGHAGDAVAAARGLLGAAPPGPVHLNVQLAPPLVPAAIADEPGDTGVASVPDDMLSSAVDPAAVDPAAVDPAAADEPPQPDAVSPARGSGPVLPDRTLVVLGDLPEISASQRVLAWAADAGHPVIAEPFGVHGAHHPVPHGVLLLGLEGFVDAHAPDAVLVVGRPTLSRPVTTLLQRPGTSLFVADAGLEFCVPGRPDTRVEVEALEPAHSPAVPECDGGARAAYRQAWTDAGARVAAAVDASPPAWGTGPALARALVAALVDDTVLFLGSSNSPRDLDIAVGPRPPGVSVVASRGLAGIDGCVSTAVGLALSTDRPTTALMGDLTFLHDANGLLIGPHEPQPDLTIVVANDDGGGIFSTLEPGRPELADPFERLFATPTGTHLAALCSAHGVDHVLADTPQALTDALAARHPGIRVIEVPLERASHRAERARLQALAAAALA